MSDVQEAWAYFMQNREAIRGCCAQFLPVRRWQSMAGPFGEPTNLTVEAFDEAVAKQDGGFLMTIMNEAWGRAPEDRGVYRIPGFTEMCNLLDGTVDGFLPDDESLEARAMQPQYTEHFETLPAPPGRVRERRWWTNSRGALVAGVLEERNAP